VTREDRIKGVHRWVKIGTMPGECAWVKYSERGSEVGATIQFRHELDNPWQEARIWKVGPPPEYRLFLEL
jgi:hypothetical protein